MRTALCRSGTRLLLAIEHRAAASSEGLALALVQDGDALALQLAGDDEAAADIQPPPSLADRIEAALAQASSPLTIRQLRTACRARTASICDAIAALSAESRVVRSRQGYELARR